jgi:ABC-type antimicrobial peptide transport system permease subunit
VNRQLAKRLWPNASSIGQRLSFAPAGGERSWFTVVGVAENVKQSQWTAESAAEVYLPYAQSRSYLEQASGPRSYMTLVVRTSQDPASVVGIVRAMAAAADRTRPVTDVATMSQVVDRVTARSRFLMSVLIAFAVLAVSVAAVGVFGVMSYAVAQRRQEIGIRVALGADSWSIAGIVLGQAALMAGVGIAIGTLAALGLTHFIAGQLYGVAPRDPASFAVAAAVLVVTGLLATAGPLLRARRIDPLSAIRSD